MDRSTIEWTDATWNPIRGCSRVSEGCKNCYAERMAARFGGQRLLASHITKQFPYAGLATMTPAGPRWTGEVRLVEDKLEDPLRWRRPRRIFVNSMSDLFHEKVPDEWIDRIFAVMALAPQHTFQVLTKRPERMRAYLDPAHRGNIGYWYRQAIKKAHELCPEFPLPNVWLGVSVEDQATADDRIPLLLQTPAAVRWISAEPLLGPIDLKPRPQRDLCLLEHPHTGPCRKRGLDWVVVGGESGPTARPFVWPGRARLSRTARRLASPSSSSNSARDLSIPILRPMIRKMDLS